MKMIYDELVSQLTDVMTFFLTQTFALNSTNDLTFKYNETKQLHLTSGALRALSMTGLGAVEYI